MVDNGSADDSIGYTKQHYPAVEIIAHPVNEGFAGGYNRGLQKLQSDYYVLLNSDVSVTAGWIEPVIELMEHDRGIGACQPKILSYNHPDMFEYAGAAGGWMDILGYPFSRGRIFDVCEKDKGQYDDASPIFWASGAAMFVRAELYHAMGGLDASFFAHQEEIDLCWRMQLAGYQIMACPKSVVYHVGAGTLPRGGRKVYLNFRNNLIMLCKNLPWYEKLWKLPARWALDTLSAWKGLLGGDKDFFIAIYQAHGAAVKWLVKGRFRRRYARKPIKKLQGVYHGSVVWQYFVKRHTGFQEILRKKGY